MKLLSLIIILLVTLIGGSYPFIKRLTSDQGRDFPIGEALAAGVFLGAGLLHMLGDSAKLFDALGYHYPWPFLLAGIIFLVLLLLEHLGREIYEHQGATHVGFAVLTLIMLSVHSFLEGAALGLSNSFAMLMIIFLAILAHKWAASFALAVQINKSTIPSKLGIVLFLLFAIMTPLGILFGSNIIQAGNNPLLEPIFTALAAGTFLYLGTLHGLSRAIMVKTCCDLKNFNFVVIGFTIMAIVAIWT